VGFSPPVPPSLYDLLASLIKSSKHRLLGLVSLDNLVLHFRHYSRKGVKTRLIVHIRHYEWFKISLLAETVCLKDQKAFGYSIVLFDVSRKKVMDMAHA
jgi:hypothetical protein